MSMLLRRVGPALVMLGGLLGAAPAAADHGNADEASGNMFHVANVPTPPQFDTGPPGEARFNSDLAFWDTNPIPDHIKLAAQGNYDGFRLLNVKDPENPQQLSVVECRGNQGDMSFFKADDPNRLILVQSIDRPLTSANCALARDTPVATGVHPITGLPHTGFEGGFEGLRFFDVTDPTNPVHIASVPTACGSHTHTTINEHKADNRFVYIYVSSYPIGASVPPTGFEGPGPRCVQPHAKISIVTVDRKHPENPAVNEQPLHADTLPFRGTLGSGGTGAVGCHDITVHISVLEQIEKTGARMVAAGACLEEGQYWDVTDPANPTTAIPGKHSHIRNTVISTRGLFHTASYTWDNKVVLFTDEFEGGAGSGCKGPQDPTGNVWFYKSVAPGVEPVPLFGRYQTPRVQPPEDACTLHNGNVVPTHEAYLGVSSAYEAGTSVFDFTGVTRLPEILVDVVRPDTPVPFFGSEVAFFDAKNDPPPPRGVDDAWSSYWHNDHIYSSSGLDRPGKRGFDVYKILLPKGAKVPRITHMPNPAAGPPETRQFLADRMRYQNPQTQDQFRERLDLVGDAQPAPAPPTGPPPPDGGGGGGGEH
jgi:hypothetical protein